MYDFGSTTYHRKVASRITIILYMAAKMGTHAGIKAKAETNLSLTFKAFPTRKMINEPAKAKTASKNGLKIIILLMD
jgi:hypothetical protein